MKLFALIIFSIVLVNPAFSQSKKDLEKNFLQLEEKTKNIESEIVTIKTNLINTTTTLGLVSKSHSDLDKLVKEQSIVIQKLLKQSDSLLLVISGNRNADFVSTPKNEEDSIAFIIQSYFSSKKWEDRIPYVLNPKTVTPLMKSFYTDNYRSASVKRNLIAIQGRDYKVDESFRVVVQGSTIIYFKKTDEGFKIDWEATTGHNPISMKTFKAHSNSDIASFRIQAEIGNYYNYNYRNAEKTHWNVGVIDNDGNSISGCYISKTSEEGKKLYEILKDGKQHYLILEIKMDTSESKSGDIAVITKFIKQGWSKE